MASDNGKSFPLTALSVVALFLSTSLLGQQAFELWRPAEPQARKQLNLPDPPVEARLWEDPLDAATRFREQARDVCSRVNDTDKAAARQCERSYRASVPQLRRQLEEFVSTQPAADDPLTVIAVLVQGGTLAGADEARRRTRHAVLAGLSTQGFVPDDSDRMGLLRVRPCERLEGCRGPSFLDRVSDLAIEWRGSPEEVDIVYEPLHTRSTAAWNRRAIVLWIDDTKLRTAWLSSLTVLLGELAPAAARLRIIGPVSSDSLSKALRDDAGGWPAEIMQLKDRRRERLENVKRNLDVLSRLVVVSPFASAPLTPLDAGIESGGPDGSKACTEDCADTALAQHFAEARRTLNELMGQPVAAAVGPRLVRTTVQDTKLIRVILDELARRGIDSCQRGRLVLISEWDSTYARRFGDELEWQVQADREVRQCTAKANDQMTSVLFAYARGLDGATAERSAEQARVSAKTTDGKDKKKPVEWPEGQAQEDYVRRLVDQIRTDDGSSPIRAIGLIGKDVHDKLILAQALRETFPDRILFTTDMDTRLFHPTTTRWTRNMIVASGLPLDPKEIEKPGDLNLKGRSGRFALFRDSYQTSTYMAAQIAGSWGDLGGRLKSLPATVNHPVLYELGRRDVLKLGTGARPDEGTVGDDGSRNAELDRRRVAAWIGWIALFALAGLMMVGIPGPSMESAWRLWSGKNLDDGRPIEFQVAKLVVASLEWAGIGFAAGAILQLGWPEASTPTLTPVLAACFGICVPLLVFPNLLIGLKRDEGPGYVLHRHAAIRAVSVVIIGAAVVYFGAVSQASSGGIEEPFAPLSGASAWPSVMLRVLIVALLPWFVDFAWFRSAGSRNRLAKRFFGYSDGLPLQETGTRTSKLAEAAVSPPATHQASVEMQVLRAAGRRLRGASAWLRDASLWFWRPDVSATDQTIDGKKLWDQYRRMMESGPRFGRVLLWSLFGGLVFCALLLATGELADRPMLPEIPARGEAVRSLITQTQTVMAIGLLVLLVLVGDETILTWRFVTFLKKGRTIYPREAVLRFARELGPELAKIAPTPVAPHPADRKPPYSEIEGPGHSNSLLDDWIDARLLADQTEDVGPTIMFPFVLVALAVIARSPIFDNWDMTPGVAVLLGLYLLFAIAMAILLNKGAERARTKALRNMTLDLIWLKGTMTARDVRDATVKTENVGFKDLAPTFGDLIERVRNLSRGAFAPFFQRPWVQAVLVPLGGAGGVQLLEFLLYARPQ